MNRAWRTRMMGAALVLASLAVIGCVAQVAAPAGSADVPASPALHAGTSGGLVPRDRFDAASFGLAKLAEAEERFGVRLGLPSAGLGGAFEGVYMAEDEASTVSDSFMGVYSNDLVVLFVRWADASIAEDYAMRPAQRGSFAKYLTYPIVRGRTAYAMPKLDIPPEPNLDAPLVSSGSIPGTDAPVGKVGPVKAGTGVWTSASIVSWSVGRYTVSVMSPDKSVDELVSFAREIEFQP